MLKPICIHRARCWSTRCKVSYFTLQRLDLLALYLFRGFGVRLTHRHWIAHEFAFLQCWPDIVDEVADQDANNYGEENPDGKISVQPAKAIESWDFSWRCVDFVLLFFFVWHACTDRWWSLWSLWCPLYVSCGIMLQFGSLHNGIDGIVRVRNQLVT